MDRLSNFEKKTFKFLLVDDDPLSLKILSKFLQHNADVVMVSDVPEAVDNIVAQSFDAVFSDIEMPNGSGFELLDKIKSSSDIPVVMVTSYGNKGNVVRSLKNGAFDFIEKPFKKEEVKACLNRLLKYLSAKQAEQAGVKLQLILKSAMEAVGEPVLIGQKEIGKGKSEILFANKAFSRLNGFYESEVIGKYLEDVVNIDVKSGFLNQYENNILNGENFVGEVTITLRSGEPFLSHWHTTVIKGDSHHFYWVCLIREVEDQLSEDEQIKIRESQKKELQNQFEIQKAKYQEYYENIVTDNEQMFSNYSYLNSISKSPFPVLICGETGTGKATMAKLLSQLSGRMGPFVPVNCSDFEEGELTETLKHVKWAGGYYKSSFEFLLKISQGGVLFLHGVTDLSLKSQGKLVSLLKLFDEIQNVNGDTPKINTRFVFSCQKNLMEIQMNGDFRTDLFHLLNNHHIKLPALRERMEDLPHLCELFLKEAAKFYQKKKPTPPKELFTLLSNYEFPGNIRELRSLIFDAVQCHQGKMLSLDTFRRAFDARKPLKFSGQIHEPISAHFKNKILFDEHLPTLKEGMVEIIQEALIRAKGNQGVAAKILGLSRQALNKRLNRLSPESKILLLGKD